MPSATETPAAAAADEALMPVLTAKEAECLFYENQRRNSRELTHYLRSNKVMNRTASAFQMLCAVNGRVLRDGYRVQITFADLVEIVTKDPGHFTVMSESTDPSKMIIEASESSSGSRPSREYQRPARGAAGRHTV
jgi:hypothetical protein